MNQAKQHSRSVSLVSVKQRFDKAVYVIKKGPARDSPIEKKLTYKE